MNVRPTPDEMPTAYFATLDENGVLSDDGKVIGVSVPSAVWPGRQLICLRLDLLAKLTEPAAAGDSDA